MIRFSPSWNVFDTPSVPEPLYLTYKVSNPSSDSTVVSLFTTVALTPDVSPWISILLSTRYFVYEETGISKKVGSIFTAK